MYQKYDYDNFQILIYFFDIKQFQKKKTINKMTSLILLNHLVPNIDILKNAIKVPYVESEHLVSGTV